MTNVQRFCGRRGQRMNEPEDIVNRETGRQVGRVADLSFEIVQ